MRFNLWDGNLGACVSRQAGAKSEEDKIGINELTNWCRDSGKAADATGSFMCFWQQDTASSGTCCSCHSTAER